MVVTRIGPLTARVQKVVGKGYKRETDRAPIRNRHTVEKTAVPWDLTPLARSATFRDVQVRRST